MCSVTTRTIDEGVMRVTPYAPERWWASGDLLTCPPRVSPPPALRLPAGGRSRAVRRTPPGPAPHNRGTAPATRRRAIRRHDRWTSPRSWRSEEHTSELQSRFELVCRLLLEKKNRYGHVTRRR